MSRVRPAFRKGDSSAGNLHPFLGVRRRELLLLATSEIRIESLKGGHFPAEETYALPCDIAESEALGYMVCPTTRLSSRRRTMAFGTYQLCANLAVEPTSPIAAISLHRRPKGAC
jgi:hypothetical protein